MTDLIRAAIFDIDNTLYSYDDAHEYAFAALTAYAENKLSMDREAFVRLHKETKKELDMRMKDQAVCHNRLIRYQNLLEKASLPLSHANIMHDLYWNVLMEHIVISDGAFEALAYLKERGIRLGIGSDMTAKVQYQKLSKLGILDYFNFIVTSEEALAEKPSPAIFSLCAKKAGCAPSECIFIGDSLKKDALGAVSYGMHGIWYNFKNENNDIAHSHENVSIINSLTEIPVVVENINQNP